MRRALLPLSLLGSVAAGLAGCGSAGQRMAVRLPEAPTPPLDARISRDVGQLLSSDPVASRAAAAQLEALGDEGRAALARHAREIPTERDPRWLRALEANGLLPPLTPPERLDYLLWKAGRPESGSVLSAQADLLDLARRDPDLLIARLEKPGPGRDALAVALSEAGVERAVPALIDLYRRPADLAERRAAAQALARLAGESRRPRVDATEADLAHDAERLETWWRETGGAHDDRK